MTFQKNDTIRDCYGATGVVLEVCGNMLFTTIGCGSWVHSTKAAMATCELPK